MEMIAGWIERVLRAKGASDESSRVREEVRRLCEAFPLPGHEDAGARAGV